MSPFQEAVFVEKTDQYSNLHVYIAKNENGG